MRKFVLILFLLCLAGCAGKGSPEISATDASATANTASPTADSAISASAVSSAAEKNSASSAVKEFSLDDYDDPITEEDEDTFEAWNRFWFHINEVFLLQVAKPVHQTYVKATPDLFRAGIANFGRNLAAPLRMANFLLQGEFEQAGVEFDRFLVNTLLSLGFADPASASDPLYAYYPDHGRFGYTFAVWGIPEGPYFMLPFYGPSTLREAFGTAGTIALQPDTYIINKTAVTLPVHAGITFNDLGGVYKIYEQLTGAALEPYSAVRSAYLEHLRQSRP